VTRGDGDRQPVRFEPMRPASRGRALAAVVLGPLLWLVALSVSAVLSQHSGAVALGLLVTLASFVAALLVLSVLHAARRREERRYAEHR
jgi:divalent metal cation (Fe/Co/Zn/Cd) transporter